jgi:hypothetical protein
MHLVLGIVVLVFLAMLGVMLYEMPKARLGQVAFRCCLALSGAWVALAVGVVLVVAGYGGAVEIAIWSMAIIGLVPPAVVMLLWWLVFGTRRPI